MFYDDLYRAAPAYSYFRLLNASPATAPADIYVNGSLAVQNLPYLGFTQYLQVTPGTYNIKVYPAGQTAKPVVNTDVVIPENTVYNIPILGTAPDVFLYPVPEPVSPHKLGRPCIRFVNLASNLPTADMTVSGSNQVFRGIPYGEASLYACPPAGNYTFSLYPSGSGNAVLTIPDVQLQPDTYYTIYAVGPVSGTPGVDALVAVEPR